MVDKLSTGAARPRARKKVTKAKAAMTTALEAVSRMVDPVLLVGEADPPSAAEVRAESFQNYIREHIETLQRHLRPGEELFVYVHTGFEIIRVLNMALPDSHTVVLTGLDVDDNPAQLITALRSVQFVCKIVRVSPQHKHNPIGFKFLRWCRLQRSDRW